jgi:hypothetical protein
MPAVTAAGKAEMGDLLSSGVQNQPGKHSKALLGLKKKKKMLRASSSLPKQASVLARVLRQGSVLEVRLGAEKAFIVSLWK